MIEHHALPLAELHIPQRLHGALSSGRDHRVLLEHRHSLLVHAEELLALSPRRGLSVRIDLLVGVDRRQSLELHPLSDRSVGRRLHQLHRRGVRVLRAEHHSLRHEAAHAARLQVRDHHHLAMQQILLREELPQSGHDGARLLLAHVDLLAVDRVLALHLPDLRDLAHLEAQTAHRRQRGRRLLALRRLQLGPVRLEHQVARFLVVEGRADRVQQQVQVLRDGLFEVLRAELLRGEGLLHLLGRVEDLLSAVFLGAVDDEGQLHDVEQHHLREGQHAVLLHVARLAERRADLAQHGLGVVDQIDLAVLFRGTHLLAHQTGNHEVHQVDARLVADLRQVLLREHEDLTLVRAAELRIHVQVFLIQGLELGVQNAADLRIRHLLHHFRARLDRIVLRHQRGETVHIQSVVGRELIIASRHELQFVQRNAQRAEHALNHTNVVFCAEFEELPRRFHIVKVGMQIGEQDRHLCIASTQRSYLTTCNEEIANLAHRHKIANVRSSRRTRSPVNLHVSHLTRNKP